MENEKFKQVNVKEPVKQDIGVLASIEHRHEYEIVADALKVYKALYHNGDSSKKLRKAVESLPETELIVIR